LRKRGTDVVYNNRAELCDLKFDGQLFVAALVPEMRVHTLHNPNYYEPVMAFIEETMPVGSASIMDNNIATPSNEMKAEVS
jgi:hypothetical protein